MHMVRLLHGDRGKRQPRGSVTAFISYLSVNTSTAFEVKTKLIMSVGGDEPTFGSISLSILKDLIRPLAHEATLRAVQREKTIRRKYGKDYYARIQIPVLSSNGPTGNNTPKQRVVSNIAREIHGRISYVKIPGKDIYGYDKTNAIRYFECDNCKRKVAGSRFAAHLERCLSGRNGGRTAKNYGDSSASPPESSGKRGSPVKRRKLDDGGILPKTQVSKFFDRSKVAHSVPVSRDSSPMIHRSMSEGPE